MIATGDRVYRLEDRNMHDRHRPTRATGTKLFAKDTVLAWLDASMIEAGGVDGDQVPVMHPVRLIFTTAAGRQQREGKRQREEK